MAAAEVPWRGNGRVWRARSDKGEFGAIKMLLRPDAKPANERFRAEVEGMRKCADIKGVLPLLDEYLPDEPTKKDRAWLVSALATPLQEAIKADMGLEESVRICLSLATTLAAMHARHCSHRDIKPSNIFLFQGTWCLGDFGLVDFPEKGELTRKGERLGPILYIAPEMLNEAINADGAKSDVYSLGKLMWKLATGQTNPLPGTHLRAVTGMTISGSVRADNTVALDALLERMTLHEPDRRPAMAEECRELTSWLAPIPAQARPTDLGPFAKRALALTEGHVEDQRRRAELQTEAELLLAQAFARFTPVIEAIKSELEAPGIGTVSIEAPAGGKGEFYHAVTDKQEVGRSDRTWLFQYAVSTQIDGGKYRGRLRSGLNLGVRNVGGAADTLHDIHLPVLAAAGHIVTVETLFGGSWRTLDELTWGDHDSFMYGQPREAEVLSRLGAGLIDSLTNAVGNLIAGMESLKLPRAELAVFDIAIGKETFKVIVSDQRHLDGIAAARVRRNEGAPSDPIESDEDYIEFVLSRWLQGGDAYSAVAQHNAANPSDLVETPQQALQATLDRAVESYWRELVRPRYPATVPARGPGRLASRGRFRDVRAELSVEPSAVMRTEIAIARNTATKIQDISSAGAQGYFNDLAAAFRDHHPKLRLARSETDLGDDFVDTRLVLQILWALMPDELVPTTRRSVEARMRSYKNAAACLDDFGAVFRAKNTPEYAERYKYFVDMVGEAWTIYSRWQTHPDWEKLRLREDAGQVKRRGGKVERVADGVLFPILCALSKFVVREEGVWVYRQPAVFRDQHMAHAARRQLAAHGGKPMHMGRSNSAYEGLALLTEMTLQLGQQELA